MNKENLFLKIINETVSDNSYLGDDCAYLKDYELIVSQDSLIEDIHFKMSYYTPYELGKKAVIVNVSDILAGGGVPLYLTCSLSGKLDEKFIKEFYEGVNQEADKYNVKIIGGDLTGADKIVVSICIMGSTKNRYKSSRKNAKCGDIVYLKGFHGSSAIGLKKLLKGERDKNDEFIKAHIEPVLYPEISYEISKNVKNYAMTDTSDGLFDALFKISQASNKGFKIYFDKIPKKTNDKTAVLFGGEDFGLLICLNPKYKTLAQKLNLYEIGIVTDTKDINLDGVKIIQDKSFNHFK